MKNQPTNQQSAERKRTQNVSNSSTQAGAATGHRTYKPRTPITKTYINIMNDPFIFNC